MDTKTNETSRPENKEYFLKILKELSMQIQSLSDSLQGIIDESSRIKGEFSDLVDKYHSTHS